jgi:hypothetical protein
MAWWGQSEWFECCYFVMFGKLSCRHSGVQLVAGQQDWNFIVDGLVGAK